MDAITQVPDLPPDWCEALAEARGRRRVLVLGPTDAGKSTFIRTLVGTESALLLDLDPGQKMLGPPGTIGLGCSQTERLHGWEFVGTTSASVIGRIAGGAARLARKAEGPLVANTAGFVTGLGARLQAATAKALQPDLVVEIGFTADAPPLMAGSLRIARSPFATRKSAGARARLRQEAFDRWMATAVPMVLTQEPRFEPAPPALFPLAARPICSIAGEQGEDVSYGLLVAIEAERIELLATPFAATPVAVRIGRIWAEPEGSGWQLLGKLRPAWEN